MTRGAILSNCEKYRFQLWRIWDESKPKVLFIMHNPSTADGNDDDPTIRRCINFAKAWGYGGMYVGNIFPYRATDPKELRDVEYITMARPHLNGLHIREMADNCQLFVLAYGNPCLPYFTPILPKKEWKALKLTKAGNPCHPLYLPSKLTPIIYST